MTDEQIRRIVRETVRQTPIELGLDVSKPEEIMRRQADFAYRPPAPETIVPLDQGPVMH